MIPLTPSEELMQMKAKAVQDRSRLVQMTRSHNSPEKDSLLLDLISLD